MIPEQFRLIATSAALVRAAGPAAALWVGNAIAAQDWSEKEHKEPWWWATKAEIEERTGLSDEMQETARRRLRDLGVLEEKRGLLRRGASLATIWYRIDMAALSAIVYRESRQSKADEPGNRAPGIPANDHASLTPSSTTEEQHPPTPQRGKRSRVRRESKEISVEAFDAEIPLHFQTEAFLEAWHAYVGMRERKHREERAKPLTPLAAGNALKMLEREAKDPTVAIPWIQRSIDNSWTGIFPDRIAPKPGFNGPPGRSPRDTLNAELRAQLANRGRAQGRDADAIF